MVLARYSDPCLSMFAAIVLPVALHWVGLASAERLLYPATSLAVAGYLYAKRSPWYTGFCIWLFCATPLVRRLADDQSGWDPSSPILFAPYIACAFAVFSILPPHKPRNTAIISCLIVMLACIAYGLVLAIVNGRVLSGIVDAIKWGVGPIFAIHLLNHSEQRQELHRVIVASLLIAGPAMAVYGVAQYISPPSWDQRWMIGVAGLGMVSIGQPAPFELRVFSTMNSPGSFGIVLATAILITVYLGRLLLIPAALVMVLGLLLSQYRSIWAGTLLGAIYLFYAGSAAIKLRIVIAALTLVLATGLLTIMPQIRQTITTRFETFSQLAVDPSGEDRMHQYKRFLTQPDDDLIFGQGLAVNGAARRLDHRNPLFIDSGIIETISVMGIFIGTVFMVAMLVVVRLIFKSAIVCPDILFYRSVAIATFCQFPFGSVHMGESGFSAWLLIGLGAVLTSSSPALASVNIQYPYRLLDSQR